jgi:predicted AlkP superfamily phosphohydrolase/phosphomutase
MVSTVLSGRRAVSSASGRSSNRIWWLRAAVPTRVRASIANALPRRAVLDLAARLEVRASDWSQVRAFTLPSDGVGYIRLNLQGREGKGSVRSSDAQELEEEIVDGLMSFADPDGSGSIASVERVADLEPGAARADMLPDLVVRWSDRPSVHLDRVISARFGEVRRLGSGSGRSGNHTDDAWAVVIPGLSRLAERVRRGSVVDIPATVCAVLGTDASGLAGESLLRR